MSLFDQNLNAFRSMRPNYTNKRTGKLGKYNDDGTVNSDVSYGLTLDYSWVRFSEDRAATRVKNLSVRREWGTPVWVEYNELTREDEVTGVHGILAPAVFGGEIAAALNNPGVPASVSTPVSANDVMPGRVVMVTDTALTVRIWATWTPHGAYWNGSTLITITPTATSSKRSFACVGITSAGASVVTLTTDRALTYPFTDSEGALSSSGSDDIKTVMDAAPTTWWVGAILISNGDTAIDPARIYDLRFWRKIKATFTAAGDSGSSQTVSEGDTLTIAGGTGLASVASATDTITLNLDINSLTADATPDGAADYVSTWDASAGAHKKVLLNDLPGGGGSFTGDATDVPYTPTTSGDWSSVPTEVGGALDTLAADVDALSAGSGATDYILIRDKKTANTAGGTFTAGAWQTRTLNEELEDTGGHASIASNQISLAAGTYRVHAVCPAYEVARHKARLQNITDTATILLGTSEYAITGTGANHTSSTIMGRFTIAGTKTIEVQHYCQTTKATNGFGVEANFAVDEIYTIIELIREP